MSVKSFNVIFFVIILLSTINVNAQPPEKAKERIEAFKKMRMLEVIELSGETADRFIVRYNDYDKDLKYKISAYEAAVDELEKALSSKSSEKTIKEKSEYLVNTQKEVHNLIAGRGNYFKDILNTEQLAKYLIFEKRFEDKLREMLLENPKKARPGMGPRGR